ncbi:orotidine-5'-phosphate decarboxylase [Polymorphobacter sp.]|uniref:orotidine-5'-phosphate decarboxylase n=1 Tax=Polymorphobacter sp. TaxID=1909290 RepID=UPI003F70BBD3
MTNPVYLAIDTTDLAAARRLATTCAPHIGGLKLGLEFFAAHGPAGISAFSDHGLPIFLDLKLHDIPNTVAGAVAALAPLAPALLTIHAAGGPAMIAAARAAAPPATAIIAVTVLTSLDDDDLMQIGVLDPPSVQAPRLAALARASGADGVVCSPHEAAAIRADWPRGRLVVPGVRPAGSDTGDQKRVMTPAEALAAGASILVIGRPITAAADPAAAAAAIAASL